MTCTVDLPSFTAQVAKFVWSEVEKLFLEKAEVDRYRNASNKTIVSRRIKMEDKCLTLKMDSVSSPSSATVITVDKHEFKGVQ